MIKEEAATNNPRTAADLLRGVREQVADIDPAAEVHMPEDHNFMPPHSRCKRKLQRAAGQCRDMNIYLTSSACTSMYESSDCIARNIRRKQQHGTRTARLHVSRCMHSSVVTPALLHAAKDIAALPVAEIGSLESVVCKCTRKARAWARLSNGGYSSTNAKAFQEKFWYSMLQFMTGPRRIASGILTIPKSDYGNPKIMRFLSPHAGGNDNLVVEETPAEGGDSDLGAYLDEMN
ncbi:unnamed protein product [Ectocarpus sp. CCAP 1310/34]|nr:unnamed protein product [Ectocarpus sp. CCAP 1310/34]